MSLADREILNRWVGERDVEAFQAIVQRYARMVYATCRRILGDAAEAEDVTQECFEALVQARKTREIKALAPWLHGMATKRSLMRIRAAGRRRDREAAYGAAQPVSVEPVWDDIYALVDEAIAELPDKFRSPVIDHFLRGESHAAIARATGTPRRTVSKRIEVGLARIGEALKQRGVSVPSVTLSGLLAANLARADALPETLGVALGKLSLAQSGKGAAAATAPVMSFLITKGLLAAVVVAVAGSAIWIIADGGRAEPVERSQEAVAGERGAETINPILVPAPESASVARMVPEPPAVALAANTTETRDTPALGTVSGHVYRDDVVPLEGARVIVYAPGTEREERTQEETEELFDPMWGSMVHPENTFHAVSDAEGFFQITGIPSEGDARINVYHKGFIDGGANIEVVAGEEHSINFTPVRCGYVAGVLLSESGAPVPDAVVHGLSFLREDSAGGGPHQAGYTDQSGGFHLPVALKDTERAVAIIMAKSKTLGNALFENVDVCPEDSITLRYPNRTSLRGNVAMPGEASASGFQVMLEGSYIDFIGKRYGMWGGWHESTEVKPDGSYAFDRLDSKPIYEIKVLDLEGKEVALNRDFLELRATPSNTVNLRVEESAWISGRVYGLESLRPIPNVRVRCAVAASVGTEFDARSRTEFTAETDSEGNFRLEVLRGWGPIQIMADYGRNKPFERTPARLVEELEIRPGGEYNVNLPMPTPWSRSFFVQDDGGKPLPGVHLQIYERSLEGFGGSSYGQGVTDAEGRVTLSALDPEYGAWFHLRKDGYIQAKAELLTGKPGETFPVETIVLQRVSGDVARLVDGNNVAFANRTVNVHLYSNGEHFMTIDTKTDERGTISAAQRAVLSGMLSATDNYSFELEIENPSMDGQDGVLYRSEHIALPEDEMEDMGTIVLKSVEGDNPQRYPDTLGR